MVVNYLLRQVSSLPGEETDTYVNFSEGEIPISIHTGTSVDDIVIAHFRKRNEDIVFALNGYASTGVMAKDFGGTYFRSKKIEEEEAHSFLGHFELFLEQQLDPRALGYVIRTENPILDYFSRIFYVQATGRQLLDSNSVTKVEPNKHTILTYDDYGEMITALRLEKV